MQPIAQTLRILLAFAVTALASTSAFSATLYLCKAYSGGLFWSQRPCSQMSATAEASFDVPAQLPFAQQVALGEQAWAKSRQPQVQSNGLTGIHSEPVPGSDLECEQHRARLKELDHISRMVRPTMTPEAIAAERSWRKGRMSALRCRR